MLVSEGAGVLALRGEWAGGEGALLSSSWIVRLVVATAVLVCPVSS